MICSYVSDADKEIIQLRVSPDSCSRTTSSPKMFVRDVLVSLSSGDTPSGTTTGMMKLTRMFC
jgi:hypothetical protein